MAQHHEVFALDIDQDRDDRLSRREATVKNAVGEKRLREEELNLTATTDVEKAISCAYYVPIATPTNYYPVTNQFDTSSVEAVIGYVKEHAPESTIAIKSTIPVGFVSHIREDYKGKILFSPEFLREDQAVYDNLHPSRIIVRDHSEEAKGFADWMA